jgi:hypothetical protein
VNATDHVPSSLPTADILPISAPGTGDVTADAAPTELTTTPTMESRDTTESDS